MKKEALKEQNEFLASMLKSLKQAKRGDVREFQPEKYLKKV